MKKLFFFFIFLPYYSFSQFIKIPNPLKPIVKAVEKGVEVAKKIATAPTVTVVKAAKVVVGAAKPSDILDPIKDVAKSSGNAINAAAEAIKDPAKSMYLTTQKLAKKIPGGGILFDIATVSQKFYSDLGYTSAITLGNILKGQNPLVITAAPLAAAIHSARDNYDASAQHLPADVKNGLKGVFSDEILNRARWVVGKVEITLPNFIGQGAKFMGDHYAVTVDDIIVFNQIPPSYREGASWWAHEITHVEQYKNLSVEVFAYNYLKDFGKSIEDEAESKGNTATVDDTNPLKSQSFLLSKIFKDPVPFSLKEIIVSKCVFDDDTSAITYLVTNKSRILAVDPISTKYVHVGYAKSPKYAGTKWTFSTPYLVCSVASNGDIIKLVPIPSPSGTSSILKSIKIGHVETLQQLCE